MSLALVSLTLLGACTAAPNESAHEADADSTEPAMTANESDMPAIYLDQRVISLRSDGTNTALRDYKFRLDICRAQTKHPVRALSDEDATKLGVTRLQRWFKPGRAAYRKETFDYSSGTSPCEFHLVSTGTHAYYDDRQKAAIDLETNEKTVSEPSNDYLLSRSWGISLEEALKREMADIDTHPVAGPPTAQSVAGAPCLRWRNSTGFGNYCVWSGGTRWGFSIAPFNQSLDKPKSLLAMLVLRQEPGPRQPQRITTERFVVGASFDIDAMTPKPATTSSLRKGS